MTKLFSILFLGLMLINTQIVFAQKAMEEYTDADFDFTNSSNYITDEQLQAAQEIDDIDDKSGIDAKIINSSHFSSGTATKTYIPINKVGK